MVLIRGRGTSRGVGIDRRMVVGCLAVSMTVTVIVTMTVSMIVALTMSMTMIVTMIVTMAVVTMVGAVVGQRHSGDGQNLKENDGATVTFFFQNGISIRAPFWRRGRRCKREGLGLSRFQFIKIETHFKAIVVS